tara:strand:- start:200 stop:970 length:771 start_codon:yes stop_codon:yes gene_type:complete
MELIKPLRALIVIGHPGHELGCLHFAALNSCRFYCVSDGAGATGVSRHQLCHQALVDEGHDGYVNLESIISEPTLFSSILESDDTPWIELVSALRRHIDEFQPDILLCDGYEGYNPVHDLTAFCALNSSRQLPSVTIPLTKETVEQGKAHPDDLTVDADSKMAAAKRAYALKLQSRIPEIPQDDLSLTSYSTRSETFRHQKSPTLDLEAFEFAQTPFYEKHGDRRVAEGKYTERIGFRSHVKPLMRAILKKTGIEA